jgi:hypothetical protein
MNQKEKPKDGRKLTDKRILYILFIIYMLFFLSQTLLLRGTFERRANLTPFWTLKFALKGDIYRFQLLVINILLTVPIGYLAAAAAWKNNITDKIYIFAACVLFFVFVEVSQYATGRGLGEFDDVFHNSLGALCGMICFYGPLWTFDAMAVILTGGGMLQIVDIIYFGPTKFLRAARIPMQIWIVSSVPAAALTVLIFWQWKLYDTGAYRGRELIGRLLAANFLSVLTGLLLVWLVLFPYHLPWYYYPGCVIVQTALTYFARETSGFLAGRKATEL